MRWFNFNFLTSHNFCDALAFAALFWLWVLITGAKIIVGLINFTLSEPSRQKLSHGPILENISLSKFWGMSVLRIFCCCCKFWVPPPQKKFRWSVRDQSFMGTYQKLPEKIKIGNCAYDKSEILLGSQFLTSFKAPKFSWCSQTDLLPSSDFLL